VLATINRAIVGVLSGERERLRVLDLNEEDVKKLEGVLKFTRVDYGSDGLHQLEREIATQYGRTDFGGDLVDSYRQFGNSAFGYESEPVRILSSMVDEGYVISGVQNDYDFGISFVDPTSRSASEENLTLPVPLTVALHDLGKLRKEINSGKELSAGTIASLHQRYVSPILNSFKSGTRGAPEGRTILRSLDFSPEGLKSGLKMVSAGASMAAYPFHQSNFENNPTLFEAINNLKTGMPEGDVHKLIDYSLSIPYQRAHAAIFKYIFERTSSDSTTPLYRGTSLSRFLFDISSKEESRSVSDPSYKTALDWAKDKAVGREISIDGLGELSSDANVSDGDFNEGVLLVFPVGSVKQQAPSTAMFTSEAGSFTSGTFTVRNIVTYSNPSEFIEAHIKAFGNQIIEAAEIKRKVLNGELNKSDIIDGFIPSVNKGFSGLSQDLFSEIEEDQNSFIEWSGAVDSQASQVNTEEENYLYSDSDILVKVLNLMMADGALDDFNDSYSYYLAIYPEAENAFNVSSNGSIQFNDEAYRRYLYDLEEQGKPVSEKTVEFLNRSVLKDPDFRTSLVRAISYLTSGRASGSPAELLETSHIPIDPDEPFSSIFSGIGYTQRNAASNDLGVPREIRFDSEGTRLGRGAIVTLSQTNNEMRSFGGKFLTDENEVTERAPVIGWTRPPKWSIVNVDEEGFQLVGGQTGSNEGGMYRNEETGEQYYVKTPRDPDIGRNEILASKLYQLAGVEVANADPAVRNGEFSVASTFVPGLETDQMLLTEERVPGVQENFAVDAWLGNWDVIGLVFDNLLIKDGRGIRIDPGGTMPYRAQGGLKNDMRDGLWGPIASDIDSMRDPGIAFEASQVFDKVTDEDLVNGIDKVISIPVDDLRKAVRDFGPVDPDENEEAFNILEARRRDLASRKADIVGDSSAAAQFISTSQPGRRFSLNDLQWEGKGTANQETSSVESFSPDRAMEKVSESTNAKGRERDRKIVRAIKDFKTSPDFDINEITPKEWGPIDDISRPSYGVVVKDDQGNIVLREVANFFDGYHWSIAKGRLDPGESPLETAVRELREETGISEDTVPNFRIVGALPGPYSSGYSDTYLYVAEFDSQPVDQGISEFGNDLLEDTPGFIPRVSKDKVTVSADQSIMDETSIPIALGEKQPRKLSATNERLVELNMETARTKGDRSYDVLQAAISPPLVHKSLWESIKDVLSDRPLAWFRQKFVDKYEGIRRAVEKAREIRGDDSYLLAGMDALKAAYLSDKSKGITQEAITSGQLIYKDGITRVDTSKKGLVEILQPLFDGNVDLLRDWHTWMIANREGRFEREGRMVSMTPQERQTVLDTARANGWTELFESVNRDYQEWNGAIVDYMVSTGVINEQMGEIFKKELAQMEADGRMPPMTSAQRARMPASMFGSLTGVKPPRKAKGGESMVVDPLTGIMRNLEAAVTSGMKNVAATRVMDDAVLIGMATEVEPNQRRADTHVVRMNGEDRFFNVFDPLLHDSLAGMGEGRIKYLNFFSAPAQFLREMVTRSPDFIMANLLRDSLSTWTTAGGTKPVVDTMRNFFSGETEASRALQSAGIISGFDNARTSKDLAKKFGKKLRDQGQTPGKKIPFWGTATKLWEWSGDVSTKSDAATRQAVYESVLQELLEKGVSRGQAEAEAIYQAAEVINFSRRGNSALAKIITAVIPFMNARIQGLDLLYRAGTGKYSTVTNETRNRALIGFLSRASLLATTSLMYAGMVEDEDEYKAARPEERDDNWIIPGFGDMPGFKIPVPFEVGFLFKTVPERVYHYYSGDQTYKQSVDAIKRGVVSTLEFNVFGPQITKPAMEAMMNHSFYTGSTIVPWYLTDADPEYQKRLSTNELAVTIGDAFNTSPLKVEHVLRGYTGTLGGYILTVADWGMRNLKGLPARPTLRADQMMIARRFLQDSEGAEGLMSEWYTFRNSTRGIMKAFNTAKKDGDIEAAREIFEKNSGVVSVNSAVNQIDNQLTRLRRAERFILMDPKTTPDQKAEAVKRIDAARNAILSSSKKIMETADLSPKFPFPLSILDD
jgi:8-oxo-dGTP pyrophosphatase MutT (NUDIX family)